MAQELLAYMSSDFTETDVRAIESMVGLWAKSYSWTYAAPTFLDATDDGGCSRPEDEPVRTVGVALTVSSPEENPETPVSEIEIVLNSLADLTRERPIEFEVQLGHTYVGTVSCGELDRSLREGLLARW